MGADAVETHLILLLLCIIELLGEFCDVLMWINGLGCGMDGKHRSGNCTLALIVESESDHLELRIRRRTVFSTNAKRGLGDIVSRQLFCLLPACFIPPSLLPNFLRDILSSLSWAYNPSNRVSLRVSRSRSVLALIPRPPSPVAANPAVPYRSPSTSATLSRR
jgi:hypothetical protein